MISIKLDVDDDYQDIDEKSINEPKLRSRQQVYITSKEDSTTPAGDTKRSSKADAYKNKYLEVHTRQGKSTAKELS